MRALARGRIWPGALEINQVAKILNLNIEVYIRSEITFKRVLGFGAANGEPWRLDYQDGCHYEPLLPRQPDFAAPPRGPRPDAPLQPQQRTRRRRLRGKQPQQREELPTRKGGEGGDEREESPARKGSERGGKQ